MSLHRVRFSLEVKRLSGKGGDRRVVHKQEEGKEWSSSRIREVRRRIDMTQQEFAHAIGMSLASVQNIESGRVRVTRRVSRTIELLESSLKRRKA